MQVNFRRVYRSFPECAETPERKAGRLPGRWFKGGVVMDPLTETDRDDWREHYPHDARLLDSKPDHRRGDLFVLAGFLAVFVVFVVWGVVLWWPA